MHSKKKLSKENVRVTVPNCQKHLDALITAATYGAHFAATGGNHFILDDVFCNDEIPVRKEQIKKMEKEMKERSAGVVLADQAKKILGT